ncbi:MAG: alkaline phosphatase D family protein [Phycisphaerae bacterium]
MSSFHRSVEGHCLAHWGVELAVCAACVVTASADGPRIVAGPMFTPAADGTLTVWIQTNRPAALQCLQTVVRRPFTPDSQPFCLRPVRHRIDTTRSERHIGALSLHVLPHAEYALSFQVDERPSETPLARCRIRPPPDRGRPGKYTIAFGSCAHTGRFPRQPIWKALAHEHPDCFLFIGDNMYLPGRASGFPDGREAVLKLYRDRYDRQMRVPEFRSFLRSTPVFAIWDDHDYGLNNSDRTWPWKDVAIQTLSEYFPNEYGLPDARGAFYRFSWGDLDFFMLDDRTFRDPNDDPTRKTMFGQRQLTWLKEGLRRSKATFKIIAGGNQMLSDTHRYESWGVQFRPERDAFLEWIWSEAIDGVVFLAGDRHIAELVRKRDPGNRGEDLWELTSSPLANVHYALAANIANPDRVALYADGVNAGLLHFDTAADPPRVEFRVINAQGEPMITRTVRLRRR